ncbi:hypothetical protein CLOM_g11862 [Closterium sp. NIES-68]|nr:hypothetical protein CLOM_g11862 [Closterium sp. NIES-68]
MWEVVPPLRLLRGMELQGAAEEEGVGEAEAVGGALAEVEAEVTIMRGMGALVAGGVPEWRAPAVVNAHKVALCKAQVHKVKVHKQTKGKDYDEVFAPVGKGTTLRVLLAIAALLGWKIRQIDIVTAFLNGIILEEVYMKQPEGLDDGSGRVCRLKKAIYGLKQAPRAWYHKLEEALLAGGFKKSECDPSLFLLQEKDEILMLLVYVDDILLFSASTALLDSAEQMLEMQFKCSKMGEEEPTVVFCDNESAVKLAKNACLHGLTKHIRPKWHWVRRLLDKEVRLEIVKTHQQVADIFTKRLAEADHWKGMKLAGMSVH